MPAFEQTAHRKLTCLNGKGNRSCRVCANQGAIIRKYDINMCRQCFRERAVQIGFAKYR